MLIDAHAHLDHYQDDVLESVLAEIARRRILTLSNAMDVPSYQRTLEIAQRCDLVLPSFGIHPWRAGDYIERLPELCPLIERSPILGEIGLDYHWVEDETTYPIQRYIFEFFLAGARKRDKLVNLHTKGAEAEVLHLLDQYQVQRVIVHWYSGPLDIFQQMVARGFYFTIGVEVLHSAHIQTLARTLPLNQLLTETDNPGGLEWLIGAPGLPHHLLEVVEALAELKQTSTEAIIQTVADNFARLVR